MNDHEPLSVEGIDKSIQRHILDLRKMGLDTIYSCSKLSSDHKNIPGKDPLNSHPYVSFKAKPNSEKLIQSPYHLGSLCVYGREYGLEWQVNTTILNINQNKFQAITLFCRLEGESDKTILKQWDMLVDILDANKKLDTSNNRVIIPYNWKRKNHNQ